MRFVFSVVFVDIHTYFSIFSFNFMKMDEQGQGITIKDDDCEEYF